MTRARDLSNLIGSGNYTSTTFTATAGQTVFTIAHTQGFIQVFMNGLLLDETTDYTSNGTAVTLTEAATAGDELEVVKYNTFSVGDAITQTDADTRYVNASGDTMTGGLNVTGGNLGIGTTSPSSPLHVVGDSSGGFLGGGIRINDTNNSSDWFIGAAGSGKFQIAEAAGSTRMIIDTSGNVGINTTPSSWDSFSGRLQIGETAALANYSSGSNVQTVLGVNTYYQSGYKSIKGGADAGYVNVSDNGFSYYRAASQPSSANQALTFNKQFEVDSAGRVKMPYQPAFSEPAYTNYSTSTVSGDVYMTSSNVFANVTAGTQTNVGNHWNASTGRFTAPVAGYYQFILNVATIYSSGYFYVYLKKNGSTMAYAPMKQSSDWEHRTLSTIIHMNANDYMQGFFTKNYTGGNIGHCHFSGRLIG